MDSTRRQGRGSRTIKTVDLTAPSPRTLSRNSSSIAQGSSSSQPERPTPMPFSDESHRPDARRPSRVDIIDLTGDDRSSPVRAIRPSRNQAPQVIDILDDVVDVDALPDPPPLQQHQGPGGLMIHTNLGWQDPHHTRSQPLPRPQHEHHHHHHHHHHPGATMMHHYPTRLPTLQPPIIPGHPSTGGGVYFGVPYNHRHLSSYSITQQYRQRRPGNQLDQDDILLDYATPSFQLNPDSPSVAPATVRYSPPPAPKEGFTRAPSESEVVVCPNCDRELATGDSKELRAVYVVKKCGHAYCGNCTLNRSKAKGKGRKKALVASSPSALEYKTRPFGSCVVDGCNEKTGGKAMIQIYL